MVAGLDNSHARYQHPCFLQLVNDCLLFCNTDIERLTAVVYKLTRLLLNILPLAAVTVKTWGAFVEAGPASFMLYKLMWFVIDTGLRQEALLLQLLFLLLLLLLL